MKKIATKFVLVAASAFIAGSAMAQTDTTQVPTDTTQTPTPTDTTSVPDSTNPSARISVAKNNSFVAQVGYFTNNIHAITDRELLNNKPFDIKSEEDIEA